MGQKYNFFNMEWPKCWKNGIFAANCLKVKMKNTMKKVLTLLVLVVMAMGNLCADNISQQKAQRVGQQFLSTTATAERTTDIQLDLASVYFDRSGVDYYAFNVRGGNGFVIVAGDDRVKPILAYSTTGAFDPQDLAEGFAYMLNSYREEIHYIREHNLSATPDIVAEWESVQRTGSLQHGRQARAVVGPLCQTIWNQNFPYNSQCPEDPEGNGGYVYAGCVATAMGQVMKFWDYPEQGTGSHTYNPQGYAQQTANFGETQYHFELMPLSLDSLSTEEDYFYIAQFLHHCGIAVDMQYSGNGSGAYSQDVPTALSNYFGYSTVEYATLSFWGINFYTNEQWIQMLKDGGLDEGMPLYYSGSDDNGLGGHAFVCDGYDENDYFHFNWGWSGRDDAWCPIGALNTTKYAFNDGNSYIGHIMPQNSDYFLRADSVADFTIVENRDYTGVTLSWNNPSVNLNGESLSSIESIGIRRNNQLIATLTDVQVGATMSYDDDNLEPGLYEYCIYVTNTYGISRNVYRSVLVGEKCPVTFVLQDDGGDGWKGAAISVTTEDGQRIAVIGMNEGYIDTITVPLLTGNLNFIWNHGWYHSNELYDTDFECSFMIFDGDNNHLYTSDELEDGIFLTYNNNCAYGTVICYPVENLQGEYQWHNGEEFGAYLTWNKPAITAYLDHFEVYRTGELVAEVDFEGSNYSYFDNTYGLTPEDTYYSVRSVYTNGAEQCESEFEDVMVTITDVEEQVNEDVRVYPNPTDGVVTIEGTGRLSVKNLLGQEILNKESEGKANIELTQGIYFISIGGVTQKVVVK